MMFRSAIIAALCATILTAQENKGEPVARIEEAAKVFSEIMSMPDKAIPQEILEETRCLAIIPGMKRAGFVVGGRYGKGVMVCQLADARWSGPSTVRIEGGSFGAQIGAGETDLVLVVMNRRGAEKLMESRFTIGADAAAMAGPVGRTATASTDALMRAQILSYSRSRGLFAGVALDGATLRPDDDDNASIYGRSVNHADILTGKVDRPASGQVLYSSLSKFFRTRGEAAREKP